MKAYEVAESSFRAAGGYALDAKVGGILSGLGFDEIMVEKDPRTLSGGWRMRLELARLFMAEPEFLILDEPTNHLDLPSLVWVERYLNAFDGTLLFVSHDRALLNRLASQTLHLNRGRLDPYRGNFDAFLEAKAEKETQEAAQLSQIKRRRAEMQKFVDRFGAKASKASQAQSRVKMIDRLRSLEDGFDNDRSEETAVFSLPEPIKTPRIALQIKDGAIGYDKILSQGLDMEIEKGWKVAIIGANGIGKSTLLKTLIGHLPALDGVFTPAPVPAALFSQNQTDSLDLEKTVLENLQAETDLPERQARSLLGGFLFRSDDVFKPARVLSGGELSRLGLACILGRRVGLLYLDEPTNHLDMASVAMLAAALNQYDGTALFVSHDRTFIDEVCTHVFAMLPTGASMLFEGKLDDYSRQAALAGFPDVLSQTPAAAVPGNASATASAAPSVASQSQAPQLGTKANQVEQTQIKNWKRRQHKLKRELQVYDQRQEKARDAVSQLEQELLELAPSDFKGLEKTQAQLDNRRLELEDAEESWLEKSEELEKLELNLQVQGRLA